MNIRPLQKNDFHKNYINLLKQLTTTNDITSEVFSSVFNSLNNNHLIYVIEYDNIIIASGTLLIEQKFINNCGKVGHIEDIVVDGGYIKTMPECGSGGRYYTDNDGTVHCNVHVSGSETGKDKEKKDKDKEK